MPHHLKPRPLLSRAGGPLAGAVAVPGDKSISHRALMLAALAEGTTVIHGLLEGEDVLRTGTALNGMGAMIHRAAAGVWSVAGVGAQGLTEPDFVLDMGNSGTSTRLLMGMVASRPMAVTMTGDASLVRRPMSRVTIPLEQIGASVIARAGGRLPLAIAGARVPQAIHYRLPVASAQVKSAILLAGLHCPGETRVIEPEATRDHTERMLAAFGVPVSTEDTAGGRLIALTGIASLVAPVAPLVVPGDISSAAFLLVAGLIVPGSVLTVTGVGLNPLRSGIIATLMEMGADLDIHNERSVGGEPVADITVRATALRGVTVPPERAPSMIDEYPILAVAAAYATGDTVMQGLAELKVKESDRFTRVAESLAACGVRVSAEGDTLTVHGDGRPPSGGARIATALDHRIAMSFLVLGLAASQPVTVDDGAPIETSFPGFAALIQSLGGTIEPAA